MRKDSLNWKEALLPSGELSPEAREVVDWWNNHCARGPDHKPRIRDVSAGTERARNLGRRIRERAFMRAVRNDPVGFAQAVKLSGCPSFNLFLLGKNWKRIYSAHQRRERYARQARAR